MFSANSRYNGIPTEQLTMRDGRKVSVVRFPSRVTPPLLGYHRKLADQRLDHLAAAYLQDPTAFWLLCDANGTVAPDALAARDLIAIPIKGG
jgi:hypothetical protein